MKASTARGGRLASASMEIENQGMWTKVGNIMCFASYDMEDTQVKIKGCFWKIFESLWQLYSIKLLKK